MREKNLLSREKVFTFFVCIMPILHQYASPIPNITLGEIGLIFFTVLGVVEISKKNGNISFSSYGLFLYLLLLTSLLSALSQVGSYNINDSIKLFARLFFYFIIIVYIRKLYFNLDLSIRIYRWLATIACVFLFIQVFAFYFLHIIVPSVVNFLPLYNNTSYSLIDFNAVYSQLFRPQSFFLEPGVLAQFLFPALLFSLFKFNQEKKYISVKFALFISISLIATLSAQAIFITLIIWSLWLFSLRKSISVPKKVGISFLVVLVCLSFVILVFNNEPLHKATLGRFVEGTSYDSTGVRVIRGFQVFEQLDIYHKFVGTGYGNVTSYVLDNNITTENDLYGINSNGQRLYNYEYMNTVAYVLVTGGIITFIIFALMFLNLFKSTQGFSQISVVILLIISIYGGTLVSTTWIIFMFYIYEGKDELEKEKVNIFRGGLKLENS
ncbi:hypothetical protein ANABIO32_30150 [Rossellomorea marisflavi]|uniref:hypothetical protein n=1 Tax=Rossellomorea marisflavi TaxID=189381 RepID=UPI0025C74E42|nr:hypothetical protein [Rossellomorea marisflavi]GLI85287.1 hypothetical protein ANABIO32_30150 [Rossellomorea marisflavi]